MENTTSNNKIQFTATLYRPVQAENDGAWTFLMLPQDASNQLPSRGMTSVEGLLNGAPFQTTLEPDGKGGHWLKVNEVLREEAGLKVGDSLSLELIPLAEEPEPVVPQDFQQALDASPKALSVWLKITPVARRDWIQWMTTGKKVETRALRIGKACDMLAGGKKRICCFDRSGMYSKSISCPVPAEDTEASTHLAKKVKE